MERPKHLDISRERGLTVTWEDGTTGFYPVVYLRRYSPSAEARMLREELESNPLAVLPSSAVSRGGGGGGGEALTIIDAELMGNYAVRLKFSDGHETGIYSWEYLRQIDPSRSGGKPKVPSMHGHQAIAMVPMEMEKRKITTQGPPPTPQTEDNRS